MKITNVDAVKNVISRLGLHTNDDGTVDLVFTESSRGKTATVRHASMPDVNITVKLDDSYAVQSNMIFNLNLTSGEITGDTKTVSTPLQTPSKSPTQGCLTRPTINY